MIGDGEECLREVGVATKALGSGDEPEIEFVLGGSEVRDQLGVVALGVVDEVAGVDLEELRKQQTGGVGEVGACSTLDLREVGLADAAVPVRPLGISLDGADELLLGHGAVEAAEVAFDFAEVADFVAEFHGYCRSQYLYRNL